MQQEIKAAKEDARDAYFEKEMDINANATGVKAAMNDGAARCRQELKSKFNKLVGMADPELTPEFIEEVKNHYARHAKLEMHQEKLYYIVTSQVEANEKVRWLKIWNGKQMERDAGGFPDDPTDSSIATWLHRQTFWYQVILSVGISYCFHQLFVVSFKFIMDRIFADCEEGGVRLRHSPQGLQPGQPRQCRVVPTVCAKVEICLLQGLVLQRAEVGAGITKPSRQRARGRMSCK